MVIPINSVVIELSEYERLQEVEQQFKRMVYASENNAFISVYWAEGRDMLRKYFVYNQEETLKKIFNDLSQAILAKGGYGIRLSIEHITINHGDNVDDITPTLFRKSTNIYRALKSLLEVVDKKYPDIKYEREYKNAKEVINENVDFF